MKLSLKLVWRLLKQSGLTCTCAAFLTACPPSLSPQMHHPIQMKPADSEKSNGEWPHTHTHASAASLNLLGNRSLSHVFARCRWDGVGGLGRSREGEQDANVYKYIFIRVMNY